MKIYVIGDSISIHYGPYLQRCLNNTIEYARKAGEDEALLDLDKPQGANGGDSSMVLAFMQEKAKSGGIDADLLLVNCGLHDIKTNPVTGKRQVEPEAYGKNLKAMILTAIEMQLKMVWLRTTPCDEAVHNHAASGFYRFKADCDAYNRIADQIMAEASVPIIDLHSFTSNLGTELYCDHVHFNEPIRAQQAAFIAGWLAAYQAELLT